LGGGDVKLFAAASLWIGPAGLPAFLVLTVLVGGALGLALLVPAGSALASSIQQPRVRFRNVGPKFRRPMPYGVAIAIAAVALLHPHFA
jgi:prepilin peptidase CpaA